MRSRAAILATLLSAALVLSAMATVFAQSPVGNTVIANVIRGHFYFTDADSTANVPVEWANWWLLDIHNVPDSGLALADPSVQFETSLALSDFRPNDPSVFSAQPELGLYTWSFPGVQVSEPAHLPLSASEGTSVVRPGFSLSRSVEPETLSTAETLQTVTVSFTLNEPLPPQVNTLMVGVGSPVFALQGFPPLVEGEVVAQVPVQGWTASGDGLQARWHADHPSDLAVGTTYTFQATIKSTKSSQLLGSPLFKPEVIVISGHWAAGAMATGNSVTLTAPDNVISATFSASNVVDWSANYFDSDSHFTSRSAVSQVTDPPPPFYVLVPADVRVEPEVLALTDSANEGVVTALVRLPEPYSVSDINVSTVTLAGAPALRGEVEEGVLVLKFKRSQLQNIAVGEQVELLMRGGLTDGSIFMGTDTVTVGP